MIRKAKYTDIRRALDIYDSARRFMRSRGNAVQWVNGYPSEELLRADVAAGQLYVMEDAGGVYAVFAFIIGDDPTYQVIDGAWLDDGTPYGTLHRLGSDGTHSGVLSDAVDWAWGRIPHLRAGRRDALRHAAPAGQRRPPPAGGHPRGQPPHAALPGARRVRVHGGHHRGRRHAPPGV